MTPVMTYDVGKRPATWVSKQAAKRKAQILAFGVLALALSPVGLILLITHHVILAVVVSGVIIVGAKVFWNLPDEKGEEYHRWALGAEAERSIGELLNQLKSEDFTVMHDIEQFGEGNIDHLVSGPTGVFMIESKAKGYQTEALRKAKRQAKKLSGELNNLVTPEICIHERTGGPFFHKKVWIVPEPHLLDWIRARHDHPVPFERLARFADKVPSQFLKKLYKPGDFVAGASLIRHSMSFPSTSLVQYGLGRATRLRAA